MDTHQNTNWTLILLAVLSAAIVAIGAAWAMNAGPFERRSSVSVPGVDVQTRGDDVKVDAPYTSIRKDDSGTSIKAPGVDIQLPPKQGE